MRNRHIEIVHVVHWVFDCDANNVVEENLSSLTKCVTTFALYSTTQHLCCKYLQPG